MFEDAEISTGGQPCRPEAAQTLLTTDDLVMMIGEAAVNRRQQEKVIRILQADIARIGQAAAEYAATAEAARLEKASLAQRLDADTQAAESLRARIVSLEDHLHRTAIERDDAARRLAEMTESLLQNRPARRNSPGKKGGDPNGAEG